MHLALVVSAIVIWAVLAGIWVRRIKAKREFDKLSITPDELYQLVQDHHDVLILDVRQPLDLLADSEIIAGAQRISPQDATSNPSIIPTDRELVVYCTCPSDKTSRAIAMKAHQMAPTIDLSRIKFLKGGLAAWKAKGYPVTPYDKTFHLDTGT